MNEITQLEDKIAENLLHDSRLANYPIDVINKNGIVTLAGEVSSSELAEAAETIARQTDGVIAVINEIVINREAV